MSERDRTMKNAKSSKLAKNGQNWPKKPRW